MEYSDAQPPLKITTIDAGFYKGFSPAVAVTTKLLVLCLVLVLVAMPIKSNDLLAAMTDFTLSAFGGWYNYLMAAFFGLTLLLVCLPVSARIRLGPEDSRPEMSTFSWLAMMFCSGIGAGILAFSVSEPLSHFVTNPDIIDGSVEAGSQAAVTSSMRFVFLHWGISAWVAYAIAGLALGLACHRFGHPMTMRSAITPVFGRRLEGPLGHMIDILSILAIIAGITTTIVLGLEQICTGLAELTGSSFFADARGNAPLTALLTALVVAIATAIASITSGLDRGVKWTSQLGILLVFGIMMLFVVFGAGTQVVSVFVESTMRYVVELPRLALTVYDPGLSESASSQRDWQNGWTIFYWAWWIAFAPFVGLFLARVSKGRTVREFILGSVLCPTIMCFAWFTATGGNAMLMELDGTAGGRLIEAEHAFRIYEAVDMMMAEWLVTAIKSVLVFLFLVLVVASSTAAIIAIKSIGAAGSELSETKLHSTMWAMVIAAISGSVIAVSGVDSIRSVMIVGALPFSVIMALMIPSVLLMMWVRLPASDAADILQDRAIGSTGA